MLHKLDLRTPAFARGYQDFYIGIYYYHLHLKKQKLRLLVSKTCLKAQSLYVHSVSDNLLSN